MQAERKPDPSVREPDAVDEIQHAWLRELPGVPVESIGVITRVWRAAKILGDERRRTLTRLGIDSATLDLLSTLRRAGPPYAMTPARLKDQCLVTAGAISQRVARAEAAGAVRAVRSPGGRTLHVELTDTGHALIEGSVERLLSYEDDLIGHLSPAERDRLTELLRKLLDGLLERGPADSRIGPPED
ncbi:MarR family winged helix-turn-helix transcriptional regulator [Actinoallomurus sp. CA-150999]|uniref:MarR family winged helix-turn-helix transcriptional regulator n=1 Tax=Actinoallomurus sp. CA-150999 TaxID=3239887 RepID=UPI003D90F161